MIWTWFGLQIHASQDASFCRRSSSTLATGTCQTEGPWTLSETEHGPVSGQRQINHQLFAQTERGSGESLC